MMPRLPIRQPLLASAAALDVVVLTLWVRHPYGENNKSGEPPLSKHARFQFPFSISPQPLCSKVK